MLDIKVMLILYVFCYVSCLKVRRKTQFNVVTKENNLIVKIVSYQVLLNVHYLKDCSFINI